MSNELSGQRIAFLVANSGVEQVELTTPWQAVKDAGGEPVLLAPEKDTVQAVNNDIEKGDTFDPAHAVGEVERGGLRGAGAARRRGQPGQAADRARGGRASSRPSPRPASRSPRSATARGPWSRPAWCRARR